MLTVEPYPYQDKAIDQGLDRGNLLIAYGMGLGKTLVQLAICEELLGDEEIELSALVVPASLKWQWAQAIAWATDVESREIVLKPRSKHPQRITIPALHQTVVIDGTPEKRDAQYAYIREHRPDYVIMGYDNVLNDWRQVKRMKPDLISLDEATAIKSFQAERTQKIKDWWSPFRYALTGTPVDNRPEELYSIMEWVDATALGGHFSFEKAYITRDSNGRPKRYKNLDILHKKIQPFVARKTRFDPDVAPYMPKDYHHEFFDGLSKPARKLYREIKEELIDRLSDMSVLGGFDIGAYYSGERQGGGDQATGEAMACFGALAMLCDHPFLLLESALKFKSWMDSEGEGSPSGSKYAYGLYLDGKLDWITRKVLSPKFETVIEKIEDILDERKANKVILFSFSKTMLRLIQDRLSEGVSVIFDGDMGTVEKERAKQEFKTDPDVRVFLSSDAGGMGVDLPEANYLINYNHPWSAGKADQRNNRHVRAGSAWDEVWVLNYIVEDSVEHWKYQVLEMKRKVGSAILDGGPTNKGVIAFDVDSLLSYLSESPL